ncbi:MAG: glycosyltransferase [Cytophagaceae bacterium]
MIIIFIFSWERLNVPSVKLNQVPLLRITVIIPCRNEAGNIIHLLTDLENQDLEKEFFEVIVVDDQSSDNTLQLCHEFQKKTTLKLKLLKIEAGKDLWISGKKYALNYAINHAEGEIIVTTDGDCRALKSWLFSILHIFSSTDAIAVSGPVTFHNENSLFEKMQTMEFASLVGSGAATIGLGFPTMCNGANLAFRKQAFLEVNGYKGVENIPSGDDEFLFHKLHKRYPGKLYFLKDKRAIISTYAKSSFRQFVSQRKRWGSKWKSYQYTAIRLLALHVFTINFLLILSFLLSVINLYPKQVFLLFFLGKLFFEFVFLINIIRFLGKRFNPLVFLLTSLFYPFYVCFIAIVSLTGKFEWKDRKF